MPLTPELQRLAAQFAAEDREIIRQAKQEREADEARRALGLPVRERKRDLRAFEGFASDGTAPRD